MFFNTLALIGLTLASQGTINETSTSPEAVYATESTYTADSQIATYPPGDSAGATYPYDYTPAPVGITITNLLGFAIPIALLCLIVARRLESGSWNSLVVSLCAWSPLWAVTVVAPSIISTLDPSLAARSLELIEGMIHGMVLCSFGETFGRILLGRRKP